MHTTTLKEQSLQGALNLALTKAKSFSKRSGFGWAILNNELEYIHCEALPYGMDNGRLAATINMYRDKVYHLVLTGLPNGNFFDVLEIQKSIEKSTCGKVHIASEKSYLSIPSEWSRWAKYWDGNIEDLHQHISVDYLTLGPATVQEKGRPWVTCITASDMYFQTIALKQLSKEFGFLFYLNEWLDHSRAILHSTDQSEILDYKNEINRSGELHEIYEVDSTDIASSILRFCASQKRCNVVLLCNIDMLTELMQQGLCDEIIHHIKFDSNISFKNLERQLSPTPLSLEDWTLVSSDVIGNCNRVQLQKTELFQTNQLEKRRLN